MAAKRHRAFRFLHPDIDMPEAEAGLRVGATGGIDMVEEHESVRQAILLLLSTVPGERVMRPDYGCELYRIAFMPNDDTTAGLAMHYVRRALDLWEPRVQVLRLDASRDASEPGQLNIDLVYKVRSTQQVEHFRLPVNLSGDLG
jgi:phage baseplate assembly protein W